MNDETLQLLNFVKKNLDKLLLTEREIKILEYRFGLGNGATHTLEETGKLFGVTRQRIKQIEEKALEKARQVMRVLI